MMRFRWYRWYSADRQHPKDHSILLFLFLLSQAATFTYSSLSLAEEQASHHIRSTDAQKQGVGQNIHFVEQLINQSATAKQIQQGDNAEARALQQKAIQELEKAKQAQQAGDTQAVSDALHKAKTAMFEAMRMSGKKQSKAKQQRDFKSRVKSVTALLGAHKRIRLEKKLGKPAEEVEQHVASEIESSQKEFSKGQADKAMKQINAAYLSIKLSVTRLRDGDSLLRELNFATKEDEYKYELERNRTHTVLIDVVLKEKLSAQMSMLMKIPMAKAEELRAQAVKQAEGGDFEKAIKTLEQSTHQIIRAIRMAGVYIPG